MKNVVRFGRRENTGVSETHPNGIFARPVSSVYVIRVPAKPHKTKKEKGGFSEMNLLDKAVETIKEENRQKPYPTKKEYKDQVLESIKRFKGRPVFDGYRVE